MPKVTQSVSGENGVELHLIGLRVLVRSHTVCFWNGVQGGIRGPRKPRAVRQEIMPLNSSMW